MSTPSQQVIQSNYGFPRIDEKVRGVQNDIWERRYELWNRNPPGNRLGALEPAVALEMLGYTVESVNALGLFPGAKSEAAGEIDCDEKVVKVSRRFSVPEQRFTLAHELGHAVCHSNMGRMHRDLPLEHAGVSRSPREIEANRFASRFLMPEAHVREYFARRFLTGWLDLNNEAVTYALCGASTDAIRLRYRSPRALARFVASAEGFDRNRFPSLASLFRVSVSAMAIRLEELELFNY